MNNKRDAVKRRIEKLLRLSKSPNENEALTALRLAQELMEEYGLSEEACRYTWEATKDCKRQKRWHRIISGTVAWLYICAAVHDDTDGETFFFGEPLYAFMSREMYRYLKGAVERMARNNVRKNARAKFRDNYKMGVACRLALRITEMGEAASWAPERSKKLKAVREVLNGEVILKERDPLFGRIDSKSAAFQRGVQDGKGISLVRQATSNGGGSLFLEGKA